MIMTQNLSPTDSESAKRCGFWLMLYAQVRQVGNAFYMEDQLNGLNGFLLWLKLFKYVGVTSRILRLAKAMIRSLRDVVTYLFLFGVLSYAFAILAYCEKPPFPQIRAIPATVRRRLFTQILAIHAHREFPSFL